MGGHGGCGGGCGGGIFVGGHGFGVVGGRFSYVGSGYGGVCIVVVIVFDDFCVVGDVG